MVMAGRPSKKHVASRARNFFRLRDDGRRAVAMPVEPQNTPGLTGASLRDLVIAPTGVAFHFAMMKQEFD